MLRDELRHGLTAAIRARDAPAVSALRSALAAVANAEAVDTAAAPPPRTSHPTVAGSAAGLGAADVERRALTQAEVLSLVQTEIDERLDAAEELARAGQQDRAERLRAEAEVLSRYVSR